MQNEYAPPRSDVADINHVSGNISAAMIESLRGTKPWTMLIAVMLFIVAGFMILATFGMIIGGLAMTAMGGDKMPQEMSSVFLVLGVAYLIFSVIYFLLGFYLIKFSTAIGRLLANGQAAELAGALEQQRKFWKLAGIMTIFGIVLMFVWIIALIMLPGLLNMGGLH